MIKNYQIVSVCTEEMLDNAIKRATDHAIEVYRLNGGTSVVSGNAEIRKDDSRGERHVFGVGNDLRDTLLAAYTAGSGTVDVCIPNYYVSWGQADAYTRMRIAFADQLRYGSGIVFREVE